MSRDHPQMKVRFPPDLKQQIADAAESSNRTLNAEILHRLELSFATPGGADNLAELLAGMAGRLQAIEHRLAALEQAMASKR